MTKLSQQDEAGIAAIIALQAMAGITETREQAIKGWSSMSDREKQSTLNCHKMFCTKEDK